MRRVVVASVAVAALTLGAVPATAAPTCADTLGVATHGEHVVADYVVGGSAETSWPPAGQVGAAIRGRGAAVPGGPGPVFHGAHGIAPGASFCTPSSSPGLHL